MPAAHRHHDICTGHSCYPPRDNIEASSDVFSNGLGCHRLGDGWSSHCCDSSCHGGSASSGSPNVFVNGRPKTRIGDSVSCGSRMATGSPNVFVNGG